MAAGGYMSVESVPTRGRTLDYAAPVYDFLEPMLMLGKQEEINHLLCDLLEIKDFHTILDIGCGTGIVTAAVSKRFGPDAAGYAMGIDAAGKMIAGARGKRGSAKCRFEAAAAEELPFENESFDSVVSSLFFHHIQLDLKKKAFSEAYRVLKPGGRLVVSDMHTPTTFWGAVTSHVSRWLLMQPQIGENIRGLLPVLIEEAGFSKPKRIAAYLGYISVFKSSKP
jgi:ubiquinone/menaquinone biosynthesis C-methylase UbiE